MRVISHRGFWTTPEEKNSRSALRRSFAEGFGTETDVRDLDGVLVISHDPPRSQTAPVTVADLLDDYVQLGGRDAGLPLALNIKSDGLAAVLADLLAAAEVTAGFVFDMSVPDQLSHLRDGRVPVFTRHSDVEPAPSCYTESQGVWLDSFGDDAWLAPEVAAAHVEAGKQVCVVSSDLHGRDPEPLWRRFADVDVADAVMICTDRPDELRDLVGRGR